MVLHTTGKKIFPLVLDREERFILDKLSDTQGRSRAEVLRSLLVREAVRTMAVERGIVPADEGRRSAR